MRKKRRNLQQMKKTLIALITILIFTACEKRESLMQDYVQREDDAFRYETAKVVDGESWQEYIIKMVSQQWLTPDEVAPVEWQHWLTIIIPDEVEETEALMVIGGGSHKDDMPESANPALVQVAMATKSIVADITNIPFQPVEYINDAAGERYEDALIAYGWRKFLEGGAKDEDAKWLARLPMTKAVVRGMDVVQKVSASAGKPVDRFVTTGASKRGWTVWTTAVTDDRVMAIIPIVIDMLNVTPSFDHHWKCYGQWSPAIDDYVNEGIMDWMGSGQFDRLMEIVEPYSFIDQLKLPKFLINATGDEFFVTDSWRFYWDDLPGEKYLQYIPNTNHGLTGVDEEYDLRSLTAFYKAVISETDLPRFEWHVSGDSIFAEINYSANADYRLTQWEAVNEEGRDFRVGVIGRTWTATSIAREEDGNYSIGITAPEEGYKAGLLEIVFNPDSDLPFTFTTGTVVTPDIYPFNGFVSEAPKGTTISR